MPAPRASHPRVVLTRPPPLPETGLGLPGAESRRLWLDGSIIVPIVGHRRAGCRPALSAGPMVALCRWQVMARPLKWLMLIAMTMGMCLMNGLFGCLAAPHGSRLRRGEGCPSTIYLTKSHFCTPCLCRVYKLFTIWALRYQRGPSLYSRRERPKC